MFSGFTALGAGPPPAGHSAGRLTVDSPAPGIRLVRILGELGSSSGARLLRLIDTQLGVTRTGYQRIGAVVVDLAEVEGVVRGGPQALAHAHHSCVRRGIEFAVSGCVGEFLERSTAHRHLDAVSTFPDAHTAVATLAPDGPIRTA